MLGMILVSLTLVTAPLPPLTPIGEVDDWSQVLRPPYESVPLVLIQPLISTPDPIHRRPFQTLADGAGDCEDMAIAGYHRRRAAGETGPIYVVIGWEPTSGVWHAVLYVVDRGIFVDGTNVMSIEFQPMLYVDEIQAYTAIPQEGG